MRKTEFFLFFIVLALIAALFLQQQNSFFSIEKQPCNAGACSIDVFFCPNSNCAEQLMEKINSSEKTIDIAIYSFTHDEIANALADAAKRGVSARVLMEKQATSQYSKEALLSESGIEVKFMENSEGIMHNKFAVFDEKTVATGSFNYSKNADERNNENLVFFDDQKAVSEFENEFERLWDAS